MRASAMGQQYQAGYNKSLEKLSPSEHLRKGEQKMSMGRQKFEPREEPCLLEKQVLQM